MWGAASYVDDQLVREPQQSFLPRIQVQADDGSWSEPEPPLDEMRWDSDAERARLDGVPADADFSVVLRNMVRSLTVSAAVCVVFGA